MVKKIVTLFIVTTFIFIGCAQEYSPIGIRTGNVDGELTLMKKLPNKIIPTINKKLKAAGEHFRLSKFQYSTDIESGTIGQTVYANDRLLRMSSHWVPNDPRRPGENTQITYTIDHVNACADLPLAQTSAAIVHAMDTWNNVRSTHIPIVQEPHYGIDWGYVQYLVSMGGVPGWTYDITHAGWLPRSFFDIIGGPGGGDYILGVTFTFIWINSATGQPTDIDNNRKNDVAFREIYYNDEFLWAINANYDVESIALHEVGHGLSQDHFGKIFRTQNDVLHFAPRAVMNAAYSGVQQELTGTDIGGHSSIWGSWPNN